MRILISGATGLIGSALIPAVAVDGHEIIRMSRRQLSREDIRWDPDKGELTLDPSARFDAVIHLAGEAVAGRWKARKEGGIRASRLKGTELLAGTGARTSEKPS